MIRKRTLGILAIFVTCGVLLPERADAFIYPIQLGSEVFETGPIPEKYAGKKGLEGAAAGYQCQVAGILWTWIHRWDCSPVVFRGRTVIQNSAVEESVAEAYSLEDSPLSFWAENGRWILLGAFMMWSWGGMLRRRRQRRAFQDAMASLGED